jgi:hypothetical protein
MALNSAKGRNKMLILGIVFLLISVGCYFIFFSNCEGTLCLNLVWLGLAVYAVFFLSIALISFYFISKIKNIWFKLLFVIIPALIVLWALFKFYA